MKILFKKLATLFIVLNLIVVPLTACTPDNGDGGDTSTEIEGVTFEDTMFAYNGQEQTLEVTGDLPEGVTATYENNTHKEYGMYNASCTLSGKGYKTKTLNAVMTIYYDDNGYYDEKNYKYKNQLKYDDTEILTENQKEGKFSNGETEVLLLNQTDANDDSKTKAGLTNAYNSPKTDADAYYLTAEQTLTNYNIKVPYEDNDGYLVVESNKIENTDVHFSFMPSCELDEFEEADYMEFYIYLYTPNSGDGDSHFTALYAGKATVFSSLDSNTWVKVRIPLNIYQSSLDSKMEGVDSKEDFYNYLKAGNPFFWARTSFKGGVPIDHVYKLFLSDLKLKVSLPDEGVERLSNNFTSLGDQQYFSETGRYSLKNVFPRYLDNGLTVDNYTQFGATPNKVVKMDIAINRDNKKSKQTLINNMYVQVNPYKSYNQLKQYDALAVTIYVDSQNPHPLVARLSVPYQTFKVVKELATFSANKWVTFEIPIEYVLAIYPFIVNTCHYDVPGTGIRSNATQELFNLTYLANESDRIGNKVYAADLYSKRVEDGNGNVSTKWTDYPSRRSTHAPRIQGTWVQYPYTLYLKSLKLVRHTNA